MREGERRCEEPKKIIVEVGTRAGTPYFLVGNKKLEPNELYVSLDIEKESANLTKKETDTAKRNVKNINNEHTIADARKMPFLNNSVDELIFTNVFGEKPSLYTRSPYMELLKEATRVLKKNGKIIINETYTPEDMPKQMAVTIGFWGRLKLENEHFFSQFGLKVTSISGQREDIGKYTDRISYGIDAFQLILTKD